jgi:hypothetical protein
LAEPAVEAKEVVVFGADMFRQGAASNGAIETFAKVPLKTLPGQAYLTSSGHIADF